MKNVLSYRSAIFALGFGISFLALTFASGEDIYRNQGILMKLDIRQKVMVVNERIFTWDHTTVILNEKGAPISIEKFKPRAWVYIEGVTEIKDDRIKVERIYLLPKYVDKKEKHLYPFIE